MPRRRGGDTGSSDEDRNEEPVGEPLDESPDELEQSPEDELEDDLGDEYELGPADEDRLPWLEAVEEDEESDGPSPIKLVAAVVIGLLAIGLIVGGLFWLGNRNQEGTGEVIAAPEGDYKVRPDQPGGMTVEGEGDTALCRERRRRPARQSRCKRHARASGDSGTATPGCAAAGPARATRHGVRRRPRTPGAAGGTGRPSRARRDDSAWRFLDARPARTAPGPRCRAASAISRRSATRCCRSRRADVRSIACAPAAPARRVSAAGSQVAGEDCAVVS